MTEPTRRVLVTGATGYIGRHVVRALTAAQADLDNDNNTPPVHVIATGRRTLDEPTWEGAPYLSVDIRDEHFADILREHDIDTVIHLAALVSPKPGEGRDLQYQVDVLGTQNVVEACLAAGVRRFIYTSSGAAYGYTPQNDEPLTEQHRLLGNEVFAYSWNKRLVEEYLELIADKHPELSQLIFRVSVVLGPDTDNQITALFEQPFVLGLVDRPSPFCMIWDQDVVAAILRGVHHAELSGIFNLTADGILTMEEIASLLGKRYLPLPIWIVRNALRVLHRLGLSPYGPEQTLYLEHRPVLAIGKLKDEFGFTPEKTTREVFDMYRRSRGYNV